ncbi:hypothetical protein TWF481_006028 [Arthrobotrys musiformis]|uniref:Nucleoside phosphorylase domain-containing protein n=1 Tax=Arthrobotrys musiformis TaxID=47236 RepID=A0AAV9WGH0_9PEZI
MPRTTRPRRKDYTIMWLCALSVEFAAARRMLDEVHPRIESSDKTIAYLLGRIGGHNVVIASLPKGRTGSIPAATVAGRIKTEFPAIRDCLLVGVGGGVPGGQVDIRLGDVVVSTPNGGYGGVVQYDSGKIYPGGQFRRTAYLNAPSDTLLSTVSLLETNYLLGMSKLLENASRLDRSLPFSRKEAGPDYLFQADYPHLDLEGTDIPSGTIITCGKRGICSEDKIVAREPREPKDQVLVHHGTIISGNMVIKDAKTRDEISTRIDPDGVLCFEMEAAGLMNIVSCLVIRGICDYADSHKTKLWQPYAAKMAAAYARELISLIPTQEVTEEVLEETLVSAPKSPVSSLKTPKTTQPNATTSNPAGPSSDITSNITGSKINGSTYIIVGSNNTVSNSMAPETVESNRKRKRGQVWAGRESSGEDNEEDDSDSRGEEDDSDSSGEEGDSGSSGEEDDSDSSGEEEDSDSSGEEEDSDGSDEEGEIFCSTCGRDDCLEEAHQRGDKEYRSPSKRQKTHSRSRFEDEIFSGGWTPPYRRNRY